MNQQKSFLSSAAWPVIIFVLLSGVYAGVFLFQKTGSVERFDYWVSRIPSIVLYGSSTAATLKGYAMSYGALIGIGLGLVYLIFAYILLGIFALVRLSKLRFGAMLAYLLASLPLTFVAYLIHSETRPRTAISAAVMAFTGDPIWYAAASASSVLAVLFILSCVYAKPSAKK